MWNTQCGIHPKYYYISDTYNKALKQEEAMMDLKKLEKKSGSVFWKLTLSACVRVRVVSLSMCVSVC